MKMTDQGKRFELVRMRRNVRAIMKHMMSDVGDVALANAALCALGLNRRARLYARHLRDTV
jgi:hypothetical protein